MKKTGNRKRGHDLRTDDRFIVEHLGELKVQGGQAACKERVEMDSTEGG